MGRWRTLTGTWQMPHLEEAHKAAGVCENIGGQTGRRRWFFACTCKQSGRKNEQTKIVEVQDDAICKARGIQVTSRNKSFGSHFAVTSFLLGPDSNPIHLVLRCSSLQKSKYRACSTKREKVCDCVCECLRMYSSSQCACVCMGVSPPPHTHNQTSKQTEPHMHSGHDTDKKLLHEIGIKLLLNLAFGH